MPGRCGHWVRTQAGGEEPGWDTGLGRLLFGSRAVTAWPPGLRGLSKMFQGWNSRPCRPEGRGRFPLASREQDLAQRPELQGYFAFKLFREEGPRGPGTWQSRFASWHRLVLLCGLRKVA